MEHAMEEIPPVSREQAFLETCFQCISQCAYEKAQELAEKERDAANSISWGPFISAFVLFKGTEKNYTSLLYLSQKWFGRKDSSLKTSYGNLLNDLRRIEEAVAKQLARDPLDNLIAHLCGQLCHFVLARCRTMDMYEQMATMGGMKSISYSDLIKVITDIIQTNTKNFHHPILSPLKTLFTTECDILSHLLQAQNSMSQCQFLPALLHLNDATTKLSTCQAIVGEKESRKFGFGSPSKSNQRPALYQWLFKFKASLVSKFSLYFHDVLSRQAPSSDMKSMASKLDVDLFAKVAAFQRKVDAVHVSLVLDANSLEQPYQGLGYHHPEKFSETLTGVDSYPAIFSYPTERPEKHWPAVVSMIQGNAKILATTEKIIHFCDERYSFTYFMGRAEQLITMVVIFENKKSEKDSYVNNFLNEICTMLRCTKLFSSIRPGKS